ncbi:MAG: hypothetical protein ACI81L_002091 [Verrucomicrobiales bacterium]|jgi:hypothetical protein
MTASTWPSSRLISEVHDMSGPHGHPAAIFGFCALAVGGPPPSEGEIIAQLVELFGPEAANPTEVFVMDWRAEAFTSPTNVELDQRLGDQPCADEPSVSTESRRRNDRGTVDRVAGKVHFCGPCDAIGQVGTCAHSPAEQHDVWGES